MLKEQLSDTMQNVAMGSLPLNYPIDKQYANQPVRDQDTSSDTHFITKIDQKFVSKP